MRSSAAWLAVAAAIAALGAEREARACGPWFPTELLRQRDSTLLDLEEGEFEDEVGDLVESPGPFYTVEHSHARVEADPAERVLYDAGALLFHLHQWDRAEPLFAAVLALPPERRLHRSTWAAFMLGRIEGRPDPFRLVRALAIQGFRDDFALASASLGEEALLHLHGGDVLGALRLYAQQAALGDDSGGLSLLDVMRDEAKWPETVASDPLGRRLLAVYLYTRASELTEPQQARVWRALAASDSAVGAAKLAAAAYRDGRWSLAGELAQRDPEAMLSRWVLAKLALRRGDRAEADRLLALVEADSPSPIWPKQRVSGERATLALADDRVGDSMALAWDARWSFDYDYLYLAERVLTIDELRGFVDDRIAAITYLTDADYVRDVVDLSELLARRLMRAGRVDDAIPYFKPANAVLARMYGHWLADAERRDDRIRKAGDLYRAARIVRVHGLELLGTELGPDWAVEDASYDIEPYRATDESTRWIATEAERARVAASAPANGYRYHYRYQASALAERAADLLPERSQAFAATLCYAAHAIQHDDPERVAALYDRYVDDGPMLSMDFPGVCPAPELDRARRFLEPATPRVRWRPIVATLLALLAVGLWFIRRRFSGRRFTAAP